MIVTAQEVQVWPFKFPLQSGRVSSPPGWLPNYSASFFFFFNTNLNQPAVKESKSESEQPVDHDVALFIALDKLTMLSCPVCYHDWPTFLLGCLSSSHYDKRKEILAAFQKGSPLHAENENIWTELCPRGFQRLDGWRLICDSWAGAEC